DRQTITVGAVNYAGNVLLNSTGAGGNISTGAINASTNSAGGNVSLDSNFGTVTVGGSVLSNAGAAGNPSEKLTILAHGPSDAIAGNGGGNLETSTATGSAGGSVALLSPSINVTGSIITSDNAANGNAGSVTAFSTGGVTLNNITANGGTTSGNGGNINLAA